MKHKLTMSWVVILLFHTAITLINAAPSPTVRAAKTLPSCFPTRPHCIRPRVDECRDAIFFMGNVDPGYPVILSRPGIGEPTSRWFGVPRLWGSIPHNCVVKIDVTDPKASDEVLLKSLAIPAEFVIKKCIIGGTGCGGSILVGKAKVVELTLAYYTAVKPDDGFVMVASNGTVLMHVDT
ncbi:MAG: hypothetical protein Q9196_005228 [Gyalolechia fulgens]